MEFFLETDSEYGNGVLLKEYNGTISLVRAAKSKTGIYMKWGYPQNVKTREPIEKAIPWGVQLGNARDAVNVLRYFLRQLTGDTNGDDCQDAPPARDSEDIPF